MTNDKEFNKSIESYITKWNEYLEYVEKLLDKVIPSKDILEGYEKIVSAYFTDGELDISSKITAVYEDLYTREEELQLNLLRNYATIEQENETSVLDSDIFFSKRLGHNNNKYPLACSRSLREQPLFWTLCNRYLYQNTPLKVFPDMKDILSNDCLNDNKY